MKPFDLADALLANIVDMNSHLYQRMFDDEMLAERCLDDLDPEFQQSLEIYESQTDSQQEALIRRFRQITIDSVSSLLGIIDGSTPCGDFTGDFALTYNGSKIGDDDLQDAFLEQIEEKDAQ